MASVAPLSPPPEASLEASTRLNADPRPLVAHVVYRFDTGGLENGVVNLINRLPANRFRHAVVALTEITDFRLRIQCDGVLFHALDKSPGHGVWQFPALYRLFRKLQPSIVHSRNLGALEVQIPAWAARVPVRIHGEHGWDVSDLHGANPIYRRVRRAYRPFVHHYVSLSRESAFYLEDKIRVPSHAVTQIYNGVDTDRFHPAQGPARIPPGCPFDPARHWIIGTVGRMQEVKNQTALVRAFAHLLAGQPQLRPYLRLALIGDGPLRAHCKAQLAQEGLSDLAWLPGDRSDIADLLRLMHVFVLPSLAEGISNTILEAMASALPVVATAVGGNADLLEESISGFLVPSSDTVALVDRLSALALDPALARKMGEQGRQRVEARFSMSAMVEAYLSVYDEQLRRRHQACAESTA